MCLYTMCAEQKDGADRDLDIYGLDSQTSLLFFWGFRDSFHNQLLRVALVRSKASLMIRCLRSEDSAGSDPSHRPLCLLLVVGSPLQPKGVGRLVVFSLHHVLRASVIETEDRIVHVLS